MRKPLALLLVLLLAAAGLSQADTKTCLASSGSTDSDKAATLCADVPLIRTVVVNNHKGIVVVSLDQDVIDYLKTATDGEEQARQVGEALMLVLEPQDRALEVRLYSHQRVNISDAGRTGSPLAPQR